MRTRKEIEKDLKGRQTVGNPKEFFEVPLGKKERVRNEILLDIRDLLYDIWQKTIEDGSD